MSLASRLLVGPQSIGWERLSPGGGHLFGRSHREQDSELKVWIASTKNVDGGSPHCLAPRTVMDRRRPDDRSAPGSIEEAASHWEICDEFGKLAIQDPNTRR